MSPQFGSTQWSVVLAAKEGNSIRARDALAALCAVYWRPLYSYVRRAGSSIEDAQDLTQGFFSHLLEKDCLRNVDPSLGRFRTFLLTSLKNFLANEWRRGNAAKRAGSVQSVSIEEMARAEEIYAANLSTFETPDRVYERNWAVALVERVSASLAQEFEAAGKARIYERLKPYLAGDHGSPYSQAAAELGISEVTVRVAVHRMRGRFRDLLLREVAQTLPESAGSEAIEEELRYLLLAL